MKFQNIHEIIKYYKILSFHDDPINYDKDAKYILDMFNYDIYNEHIDDIDLLYWHGIYNMIVYRDYYNAIKLFIICIDLCYIDISYKIFTLNTDIIYSDEKY